MSEAYLWKKLKNGMKKHWLADRIENSISTGMPDVNYCITRAKRGWIELKYLEHYPKRPKTKIRLSHFTQEQRNWLIQRSQVGEKCFVFLQIEKDYFLFEAKKASQLLGKLSSE